MGGVAGHTPSTCGSQGLTWAAWETAPMPSRSSSKPMVLDCSWEEGSWQLVFYETHSHQRIPKCPGARALWSERLSGLHTVPGV